jgi:hypothetical protein
MGTESMTDTRHEEIVATEFIDVELMCAAGKGAKK